MVLNVFLVNIVCLLGTLGHSLDKCRLLTGDIETWDICDFFECKPYAA